MHRVVIDVWQRKIGDQIPILADAFIRAFSHYHDEYYIEYEGKASDEYLEEIGNLLNLFVRENPKMQTHIEDWIDVALPAHCNGKWLLFKSQ